MSQLLIFHLDTDEVGQGLQESRVARAPFSASPTTQEPIRPREEPTALDGETWDLHCILMYL